MNVFPSVPLSLIKGVKLVFDSLLERVCAPRAGGAGGGKKNKKHSHSETHKVF